MMRGAKRKTDAAPWRPGECDTADASVVMQLSALKRMTVVELKTKWESLFGSPAPNNSRSYLELRLGYRIQELTLGGLSRETRRTLDLLADEIEGRVGRKLVVTPDGVPSWATPRTRIDNTMIKALARAFRWRKLLKTGVHATVEVIAAAEKINTSCVSRILRLTLLAPDIVEAILDGRQPALTMATLMTPFPLEWEGQRAVFQTSFRA